MKRAVWTTKAGLVAVLAHGLRREVGRVGLDQQPFERRLLRRVGQLARLRVGDVAGEGDPPAVLDALVEAGRAWRSSAGTTSRPCASRASVAIVSSSAARVWMIERLVQLVRERDLGGEGRSWSRRGA
jgi:hypothetical protein